MKRKTGRALLLALVFVFAFMALVTTDTVRANAALAGETESTDAVVQTSGVEAGAYEVTSYIVRATVQKDHSYNVTETIGVNIPDQLQSIEFAIPSGNFRVSDVMVDNSSYNTGNSQTASKVSAVKKRHEIHTRNPVRVWFVEHAHFPVVVPHW